MAPNNWKTFEEWRKILTPEQYSVTREKASEHPFTGKYWDCQKDGIYQCVCCGQNLFDSKHKYNSRTGWASFYQPIEDRRIFTKSERKWGHSQEEVLCSSCDAHLGHMFKDGPKPTGLRYTIKSAAINLVDRKPSSEPGIPNSIFSQ
jgi:peptide-methionine (R)-S-oxide reductase